MRWLKRLLHFLLRLLCCDQDEDLAELDHVPLGSTDSTARPRACGPRLYSRPLQDVGEHAVLLDDDEGAGPGPSHKMTPQEKQFAAMRKPSFTTKPMHCQAPWAEDEVCLICLEEFTDTNPKNHLTCGHGFHLGCVLEWEERGKTECPICDITVGSLSES
jgi:Ring finger domain